MAWTKVTASTTTWDTTGAITIAWQRLSLVTDANDGVDFFPLYIDDQHPWAVNDSRPHYFVDTPTEPL